MVGDSLKPIGLMNSTPREIEPRKDPTARDDAVEAAWRFTITYVERSIKQVGKRQPNRQRIIKEVAALVKRGCLERVISISKREAQTVMKAEGVQDDGASTTAYKFAKKRLDALTELMSRPRGRPRTQTDRSNSVPISSPSGSKRSQRAELIRHLAARTTGAKVREFARLEGRDGVSVEEALSHIRWTETPIEEVLRIPGNAKSVEAFIEDNQLDPKLKQSFKQELSRARTKAAMKKLLKERLSRRVK